MDLKLVSYDVEDAILLITINRPEKLNALNAQVLAELDFCFRKAKTDRAVRGVILTGAGEKSFVAGADIEQFASLDALSGFRFALKGQAVFNRIEVMPKPVIAAINGYALGGGCELALACHLRVAAENAELGQPEVNLGILPGYGGTQRLPRLIGRGLAAELVLTGERFSAQRAYEMGLVNRVVAWESLLDTARQMMSTILSRAPLAVSMALDALRASDLPLDQGLKYEAALFGQACQTEDQKEGVRAFLEKRKPRFLGK